MKTTGPKNPGIVIAGLSGGSGKTIISLGIVAAWKKKGFKVSVFKKGPDYIDAGWLSKAAGRPCYNLDTFLCDPLTVTRSYLTHSKESQIAVIEGNRGLYDGIDTDGSTSTAELAKLLNLPVLLVLDCTKSTRTMAALLMGCMHFDPQINICGVILNRVAGKRHEGKIRANIEKFCDIPVLGAVSKLKVEDFPERHMGLVTSEEHTFSQQAIAAAVKVAEKHIDLDALYQTIFRGSDDYAHAGKDGMAGSENTIHGPMAGESEKRLAVQKGQEVTIGIIRDSAFQFYYPDNIDALEKLGAKIVYISPLKDEVIPQVDAIYMGGGFPETHAPQLAKNERFKDELKQLSDDGLPIYAECGGFIFLGASIILDRVSYPMTGILPVKFGLSQKPQGHGYTLVEVVNDNPFYTKGEILKGHEFRYSSILEIDYSDSEMAFKMERGKGILDKKDGFFKNNTFGTYTHIHALGSPSWAKSLIRKAICHKTESSK